MKKKKYNKVQNLNSNNFCFTGLFAIIFGELVAGRSVNNPSPSTPEVRERVELHFYFVSGTSRRF